MQEMLMLSPNYSTSRGPYNKIVFHTTEGAMTIESLGDWFGQTAAACSSHHGADQYKRVLGCYVYEQHKAWTQGNANPYCLSLEMCAYASWSRSTWLSKPILLDNAAEWCRYLVDKYDVPWTLLNNSQAQNPDVRGICQHVNFGSWGSNHSDCGSGFPMDVVIDKAKKWGGTPPAEEGIIVSSAVASYKGNRYYAYIAPNGNVCMNGGVVDPGSNARNGLGLDIDQETGLKTICYTNQGGKLCIYEQQYGSTDWGWASKEWNAK
jgi:hypothetical protein